MGRVRVDVLITAACSTQPAVRWGRHNRAQGTEFVHWHWRLHPLAFSNLFPFRAPALLFNVGPSPLFTGASDGNVCSVTDRGSAGYVNNVLIITKSAMVWRLGKTCSHPPIYRKSYQVTPVLCVLNVDGSPHIIIFRLGTSVPECKHIGV